MKNLIQIIRRFLKAQFIRFFSSVSPVRCARRQGVTIGKGCRFIKVDFATEPYLVSIGNHVSATQTAFITHDGGIWIFRDQLMDGDVIRPISVGNNVFIGYNCTILPGVTIGNNVVIGAGSVVSRDIPSNVVAAGVPARKISDIETYFNKCKEMALLTKHMGFRQKKDFLTNLTAACK